MDCRSHKNCLYGLDDALDCLTGRRPSRVWVRDLPNVVRTGDVILFSSYNFGANITKCCTASEWDHVGIVVRPDAAHTYMLEWVGGLVMCNLVKRMLQYHKVDSRLLCLRRLHLEQHKNRVEVEERLEAFACELLRNRHGANQVIPFEQVVSAWINAHVYTKEGKDTPVEEDLSKLFCSKTVAVCYKTIGLIAPTRRAQDFLPKHFARGFDSFLDLQARARVRPAVCTGAIIAAAKL